MAESSGSTGQVEAECAVAFDETKSNGEREAAMQTVSGYLSGEHARKMMGVVCDAGAAASVRSAAMRSLTVNDNNDEEYIDELLSLTGDFDELASLRATALDILQQSDFASVTREKIGQTIAAIEQAALGPSTGCCASKQAIPPAPVVQSSCCGSQSSTTPASGAITIDLVEIELDDQDSNQVLPTEQKNNVALSFGLKSDSGDYDDNRQNAG
ncbi:MAG: hypothetical protein AAF633_11515 [Chloroflexota bacterium]